MPGIVIDLPIHLAAQKEINTYDHNGFTPLHLAVLNHHMSIIKALVEHRYTNINIHNIPNGNIALILAVQKDNLSTVALLLKYKADFGKRNREGKAFCEFAISEEMKSITSKYKKLLNKLNSDSAQSILPRPLACKRKRHSNTSDSSENSMSKLQVPKRAEYIDQSSPFSKPSIYEYRTLIDISNSSQSESSEGCNRRSSDESTVGSNLSETIIHKCERYLNVSNGSSSEFNSSESYISQNAKRIRLK